MRAAVQPGEVSICIPAYNGERFLDAAIRSAREQADAPLEILVVDDRSTDGSLAVAERHTDDPRVRIVRNDQNLGLTENWNRCVELARGPWVKFLFQDDLLAPDCLTVLCGGLSTSGASIGFVSRNVDRTGVPDDVWRAMGPIETMSLSRVLEEPTMLSPATVAELALHHWAVNVLGEPTSVMFRKELAERYGPFDSGFRQLCDWEFWLRVGANEGIWFDTTEAATFRVHADAMSVQNRAGEDGLLIAHERALLGCKFLFDDAFRGVRLVAAQQHPPIDIQKLVVRQVTQLGVLEARARHGDVPDAQRQLLQRYPDLPLMSPARRTLEELWLRVPSSVRRFIRRHRPATSPAPHPDGGERDGRT